MNTFQHREDEEKEKWKESFTEENLQSMRARAVEASEAYLAWFSEYIVNEPNDWWSKLYRPRRTGAPISYWMLKRPEGNSIDSISNADGITEDALRAYLQEKFGKDEKGQKDLAILQDKIPELVEKINIANARVVEFNPTLTFLTGWNTSVQFLGGSEQAKSAAMYTANYMLKNTGEKAVLFALFNHVREHIKEFPSTAENRGEAIRTCSHFMQRILNSLCAAKEVAAPIAAAVAMGIETTMASHGTWITFGLKATKYVLEKRKQNDDSDESDDDEDNEETDKPKEDEVDADELVYGEETVVNIDSSNREYDATGTR